MINQFLRSLLLLLSLCTLLPAHASNTNLEESGKYVSINIEIKELRESGQMLKQATTHLANALNKMSEDVESMSPEQLKLMNELADKVDKIVQQINLSFESLPQTLDKAKAPTEALVNSALASTREQTIDPIVETVETWVIVTAGGLGALAVLLLLAMYVGFKSVAALGDKMKDIANGYRVIPLDQYTKINKE